MFEAEIIFDGDVLYRALKADVLSDKDAEIITNAETKIVINAETISDLRAKLNSYLRLIEVAINTLHLES